MNTAEAKKVLETALLCAHEALSVNDLKKLFVAAEGEVSALDAEALREILAQLQRDWTDRGIELAQLSTGWRFQSRPEMKGFLDRLHPEKPPKYSRATLETLAIIAYRQPVTRGDIEEIRGVSVNSLTIKMLEDRGWVDVIGHRDVPGRPALLATTRQFLDDLGLSSLDELPPLQQVGQNQLPGGPNTEMHAMEQSLQSTLDQAAIDFSDGSADAGAEQASLVSVAHADESDATHANVTLQADAADDEQAAAASDEQLPAQASPQFDEQSPAPTAEPIEKQTVVPLAMEADIKAPATGAPHEGPANVFVPAGTEDDVSGPCPEQEGGTMDGAAETEDTLPEAKDDRSKSY